MWGSTSQHALNERKQVSLLAKHLPGWTRIWSSSFKKENMNIVCSSSVSSSWDPSPGAGNVCFKKSIKEGNKMRKSISLKPPSVATWCVVKTLTACRCCRNWRPLMTWSLPYPELVLLGSAATSLPESHDFEHDANQTSNHHRMLEYDGYISKKFWEVFSRSRIFAKCKDFFYLKLSWTFKYLFSEIVLNF